MTGVYAGGRLLVVTLKERFQWILDHRPTTARGEKMLRESLSRAAGRTRTHVAIFMRGKDRVGMKPEVLRDFAYAGQVSLTWLTFGTGSPDDADIPKDPPAERPKKDMEARERAIAAVLAAFKDDFDRDGLEELADQIDADEETKGRDVDWWFRELRQRQRGEEPGKKEPPRGGPRGDARRPKMSRPETWPEWSKISKAMAVEALDALQQNGPTASRNFRTAIVAFGTEETEEPRTGEFTQPWLWKRVEEWLRQHPKGHRPLNWNDCVKQADEIIRDALGQRESSGRLTSAVKRAKRLQ